MKFVGIDVSKKHLDVSVRPSGEAFQVANGEEGIAGLVARLQDVGVTLVVMEATGGFEAPAAAALVVAGLALAVVNPRQVRDFAKATGKLAKTDKLDAALLAHFADVVRPEPRGVDDEKTLELSAALTRRRQIVDMITAEKNRMYACRQPKLRKTIYTHVKWLEEQLRDIDKDLDEQLRSKLGGAI